MNISFGQVGGGSNWSTTERHFLIGWQWRVGLFGWGEGRSDLV
jgi:hypothetical protein